MENIQCPCQSKIFLSKCSLLEEFTCLRTICPALKDIVLPDATWEDFRKVALKAPNPAKHQPFILGAFKRGFLKNITAPIHRYLLDGSRPKTSLTNEYKQDLMAKWVLETDPAAAHPKARMYKGKLVEIMIAAWLEDGGWTIDHLAALGGKFDIEATSPDQKSYAIEVKYIEIQKYRYAEILESLESGEAASGSWNDDDGYNYMLFRTFEAAKQLSTSPKAKDRLCLIVVSNVDWEFLENTITERWICSRPLRLSDNGSDQWKTFLAEKKREKRFANIETELDSLIGGLKEWVLREDNFIFSLVEKIEFN